MCYCRVVACIIGFFSSIFCSLLLASSPKHLPMNLYEREIPFANEQSYAVVRDSAGYYWIGSGSGLIRYDGSESVRILDENKSAQGNDDVNKDDVNKGGENKISLSGAVVIRLIEFNNQLWAGTAGQGLYRIDLTDHQFKLYREKQQLSHGYVTGFLVDQYQRLWVLTVDGLNLYKPLKESFQQYVFPRVENEKSLEYGIKSAVAIAKDTLLVATHRRGFLLLDINSGQFVAAEKFFTHDSAEGLRAVLSKSAGELLRTENNQFVLGVENSLFEFTENGEVVAQHKLSSRSDREASSKALTNSQSLISKRTSVKIKRLTLGVNGDVWVVSSNSGLYKWDGSRDVIYHGENAMPGALDIGNPYSLFVDSDGALVISYLKSPPRFWNSIGYNVDTVILSHDEFDLRGFNPFLTILESEGAWLFSDDDHFLFLNDSGEVSKVVTVPGQVLGAVKRHGALYVSTYRGVYRYDDQLEQLKTITTDGPALVNLSHQGQLWVRMPSGVLRIDKNDNIHRYLSAAESISTDSVFSVSDDGQLYLLAKDILYRYESQADKFLKLHNDKLPSFGPTNISIRSGQLYIFGEGLHKTALATINSPDRQFFSLAKDSYIRRLVCVRAACWMRNDLNSNLEYVELNKNDWRYFRKAQGFPYRKGSNPIAYHDEFLWIASPGLVHKIRNPLGFSNKQSQTKVHSLRFFRDSGEQLLHLSPLRNIAMDPTIAAVRFSFSDGNFYKHGDEQPFFRLLGLSDKWIRATNNHATFSGLSPGDYVFQVKSRWDTLASDEVSISVSPAWWNSWVAFCFYTLMIAGLISLLYFLRWDKMRIKRESNQKILEYAKGMEGVSQGVCVIESDGLIVSANSSFKRFVDWQDDSRHVWDYSKESSGSSDFKGAWPALKGGDILKIRVRLKGSKRTVPVECSVSKIEGENSTRYIALFSDISERLEHENELRELASSDTLTRLHNRYYLNIHLAKLIETEVQQNGRHLAVVFLDVDRFKNINDSLSHYYGDLLLVALANRLQACLQAGEFLARLGGDEFVVVSCQTSSNWDVSQLAKRILSQVDQAMIVEDKEFFISLSLGVAVSPEDGRSVDELLRHADAAMYSVKAKGGNDFAFYTQRMSERSRKELELESELRKAISCEEFQVHYQVKICLATGRLMGLEALLRWLSPDKGMVSPGDFIDVAERTGLIIQVGRWVLHAVAKQLQAWTFEGLNCVPVAVNVSPQQLLQPNFAQDVSDIFSAYDFDHRLIEFEITEGMVMENMESCIDQLKILRLRGHKISVDDFGTGYSSLSYLKKLPIDVLKIDQSFVLTMFEDSEQHSIVKTIIELAHNLQLTVVAEGVETIDIHFALRDLGCTLGQGYFYAKALQADDPVLVQAIDVGEINVPMHLSQKRN